MADKKLIFRNKYGQNNFGIYHYLDGNTNDNYYDSDSIPIQYDKFSGKDLYTTSVGNEINEAIMSSEMRSSISSAFDALQYVGESFLKINKLIIKNSDVNSDINDVYFNVYILSHAFSPLKSAAGEFYGYDDLLSAVKKTPTEVLPQPALFWNQHGPDYDEGESPGNIINNETIFTSFDLLNNAANVVLPNTSTEQHYANFDPKETLLIDTTGGGEQQQTNIFQEDGIYNPIYIAVHMDGDMDTTYDKSRNENLCVYEISPEELFDWNGVTPQGAIKTLDLVAPAICRQSDDQDYTHAWSAKELSITVNTTGGSQVQYTDENGVVQGNYNPPDEFKKYLDQITPALGVNMSTPPNQEQLDSLILNMFPNRQINGEVSYNSSVDLVADIYYGSRIADYLPVVNVNTRNISNQKINNFQAYYESQEDRAYTSSPSNVELKFYSTLHPLPITDDSVNGGYYFDYFDFIYTLYDSSDYFVEYGGDDDLGFELENRLKFTGTDVTYHRVYWEGSGYANSTTNIAISNDVGYMYLVVDWNDRNNKYKSIEDVLVDWPRTISELGKKQKQNLYYIKNIHSTINNNYNTPGIKNIKSIMFSYNDVSLVEPLRWKLVTTRIFLDIPVNEFPDFGEVGGSDYITIPWPYTTPIIGGVSQGSKYLKSIDETLSGGTIGDLDIIDENFLVTAQEEDELGQNIEKMDLEQVRFFNQSYDLNKLLNIPIEPANGYYIAPYTDNGYWDGETNSFSEETSVGQIFINDNLDLKLKSNCQLEFNTGNLTNKSIDDSSGKGNKGLLIGDYKVKKIAKGQPMRRDSFIKVPKKTSNKNGAL